MSPIALKLLLATTIFAITAIAGWLPFKRKIVREEDFSVGETLATGVFLGAALLHMMPEANEMFHSAGYEYPFAFIITGAIFLTFLWFEHLCQELYHGAACNHGNHAHEHKHNHPAFAFMAWIMLSIHAFVVGCALGVSNDFTIVIMLFFAIIAHKWAESFALAVQMIKSNISRQQFVIFFTLFTCMTPAGILTGLYFNHDGQTGSLFDPILLSISAGTFLYLGTLHGLERCVMVKRCCNLKHFSYVIAGFLIMASVASFV